MTNIQAVTRERHATKYWRKAKSLEFASKDSVILLSVRELSLAMMTMSIGIMEDKDGFTLVGVMGLVGNQNLYVSSHGQWLGSYLPVIYRYYPFRLAATESQERILCIDEDSGLIGDGPEGERFFSDDGKPMESITEILRALGDHDSDKNKTRKICALLHKHELVEAWPIQLQQDNKNHNVEGLYRINEKALNSLDAGALVELRDVGALMVAYSQLFSMQQLPQLGKLASIKSQAALTVGSTVKNKKLIEEHGILSFDNL